MATKLSYDQLAIELGRVALSRDELRFELYDVKQERDTYRDLCAELIEKMREIKMIVNSPLEAYYIAVDAITKAEAILGEGQ